MINTEERERVDQGGRKMSAHKEREGGSSSSARAGEQEPETLHGAREGTDTLRVSRKYKKKWKKKRRTTLKIKPSYTSIFWKCTSSWCVGEWFRNDL